MLKKIITNIDLSKVLGPDCVPVVILEKCQPEFSFRLAELFNKCPKESCFPDCWKVSSLVPELKNVGERFIAKNYPFLGLLFMVSKVLKKL